VTGAEMGSRGSRPGDLHRRRVLLLAESAGLAAVLSHLLDPADRLSRIGSLRELAETRALENTDVVVLDVPAEDRAAAVGQIRRRYLGPLVVLAARGENIGGLRLDDAATLLARPFSADDLGAALAAPGGSRPLGLWTTEPAPPTDRLRSPTGGPGTGPRGSGTGPVPPATTSAGAAAGVGAAADAAAAAGVVGAGPLGAGAAGSGPVGLGPAAAASKAAELKAAARQAPVRAAQATGTGRVGPVERVQRLLIRFTEGWQAKRRFRVAGFSVFALVAFTVAFALAAQGRCGPGCDAFGTGFSPAPTVAPSGSHAPATTGPKRATTTTGATGSPGTGAFRGISGGRLATTTTVRKATTTTRKPGGSPTTRPATTRPVTTQSTAPPTTAPPTTAPPTTAPPVTT
jgi:hypothetical protein